MRAVGLVVGLGLVGCGAPDERIEEDVDAHAVGLDVRPGDRVEWERVRLIAPEHGFGVFAEVVLDDGATWSVRVESRLDGRILLFPPTADDAIDVESESGKSSSAASSSPPPCQDGAASSSPPWKWKETFHWSFNSGTTPNSVGVDAAENALKKATANITKEHDDCGLADQVSATQVYGGRVSKGTQVQADGSCGGGDGHNVVGFGALPGGFLGVTCVWFDAEGTALESDVRLNDGDFAWTASVGPGCKNRWSIEAVATHERGHTFGIGHVAEATHGKLTMSPLLNGPCQNGESTLGLGDVKALRAKY